MDYPKLSVPIILILLAVLSLMLAWKEASWPDWARGLLVIAGLVLIVAGALELVNWIAWNYTARLTEYREAVSMTERVKLLEKIANMTPDQISVISKYAPVVEIMTGAESGPIFALKTHTGNVPWSFVEEFIQHGSQSNMAPIRGWSEGTAGRRYAEDFTGFMIYLGYAEESHGNQSARWVDYHGAMKAIGYEEANHEG